MGFSLKIGFYYTHYQCLGHTTRVHALLSAIKECFYKAKIFCLQGSLPQKFISFPKDISYFNLPYPLFTRDNFLKPYAFNNFAAERRAKVCLQTIHNLRPDVFFTEFFPLGRNICKYELLPTLAYIARHKKKLFSSAGYPVIPADSAFDIDKFSRLYDKIFIHSPRMEMHYISGTYNSRQEKKRYLDIFSRLSEKIVFTNYLLPVQFDFADKQNNHATLCKGKTNILITRGAGAYHLNIVAAAIKASDMFGDEFNFVIITGPSTIVAEWRAFQYLMLKKSVKNAVLYKHTSDMSSLLKGADLCVCPAPYNTSIWLLYFKKNAVLIPFVGSNGVRYREQAARARMLSDILGSAIIDYEDLTASRLALQIKRKLKDVKRSYDETIKRSWFSGKKVFLEELSRLIPAG
ncbi:MAG: glycosyltransferase [Candidatus Firestonebacteria bacterium]